MFIWSIAWINTKTVLLKGMARSTCDYSEALLEVHPDQTRHAGLREIFSAHECVAPMEYIMLVMLLGNGSRDWGTFVCHDINAANCMP